MIRNFYNIDDVICTDEKQSRKPFRGACDLIRFIVKINIYICDVSVEFERRWRWQAGRQAGWLLVILIKKFLQEIFEVKFRMKTRYRVNAQRSTNPHTHAHAHIHVQRRTGVSRGWVWVVQTPRRNAEIC